MLRQNGQTVVFIGNTIPQILLKLVTEERVEGEQHRLGKA